jgi:SAM-dependent methyltransferase
VACKTQPQVPERLQRLVFGEEAELYDETRPTYPDGLVDDLVAWTGSERRALEVGAGTGKATRLLAARGVAVLAVEPSAEMASVARRATAGLDGVEFVISDFERADLSDRRFPLVYAAQSWHWVDPATGYAKARAALLEGGHLVLFWNRPNWVRSALREALDEVYERFAPEMPLRPGVRDIDAEERWELEIAGVDGFADPEVRRYDWALRHNADGYADLVATHSDVRLLDPERRGALLEGIRQTISAHGDSFELPMYVRVCVARAV